RIDGLQSERLKDRPAPSAPAREPAERMADLGDQQEARLLAVVRAADLGHGRRPAPAALHAIAALQGVDLLIGAQGLAPSAVLFADQHDEAGLGEGGRVEL